MANKPEVKAHKPNKPQLRSPNHPVVGLEKAVELASKVQEKYGTHEVPAKLAHKLWEYKEGSGIADQCVAALKAYGLIATTGKADDRKIVLTDSGDRITRNAPDRVALIRKSAMSPAIHREIVSHFGAKGVTDNDLLRQYLVWDRPEGSRFNQDSVNAFIGRFRKALDFSGATVADIIGSESIDVDDPETDETPASQKGGNDMSTATTDAPASKNKPAVAPTRTERTMLPAGDGPYISFPLSGGNSIEIRLRSKVTPEGFEQIKKLVELSESSLVEKGGTDDPPGPA